jgi:membrane fusion protein, multidrug efflux system
MSKMLMPALAVLACAATLPACGKARAGDEGPASGRPVPAVEVSAVAEERVAATIDVIGSVAPKFQVEVKSEYSGIVTDVYVTEWVRVRKGAPLARLDHREITTALEGGRALVLQAEVAETRAVRELERAAKLKEYGLATEQQLDDARTAREAAEASTAAARAQLRAIETRLTKTRIDAPLDGIVAFRGVNVGDRVESMGGGGPMFRLVDPRVMELTVKLPSAHLARVRVGQPLEFTVDAVPGRTFEGRVMFINPTVDAVSRAALLVAEVPNPTGELRGGLFARGRILTGERGALHVPRSALQNWQLETRAAEVYVVNAQELAERRTVRTGGELGERVEVEDGLQPGERVVSRGGFNVRHGERVRVVTHVTGG